MQKQLLAAFLFILCSSPVILGQSKVRVRGVIRDQTSAVVPGLSLSGSQDIGYGGLTDINGQFTLELSPGDHIITSSELADGAFRAFIRITEAGPNPEFVELTIDSSSLCRQLPEKYSYPGVLKTSVPKTPPAAKAVRALGTVRVMIKPGSDGKVISAKAISGHPLLRKAAENAAMQFEFNALETKAETELPLHFIFIDSPSGPAKEIARYSCPYRIIVDRDSPTIDVSTSN